MSDWVYGFHAVEALLRREPKAITVLWLATSRRDKRAQSLLQLAADQGVAVERVTGAALDNVATGRHQGIAVQVNAGAVTDAVDEAGLLALLQRHDSPLLLILDGVTDPHNLGACLRTADAAGVTAEFLHVARSADADPVALTAQAAAGLLEVDPAQIAKSILFLADGQPVLVVLSGNTTVNPRRLRGQLNSPAHNSAGVWAHAPSLKTPVSRVVLASPSRSAE